MLRPFVIALALGSALTLNAAPAEAHWYHHHWRHACGYHHHYGYGYYGYSPSHYSYYYGGPRYHRYGYYGGRYDFHHGARFAAVTRFQGGVTGTRFHHAAIGGGHAGMRAQPAMHAGPAMHAQPAMHGGGRPGGPQGKPGGERGGPHRM